KPKAGAAKQAPAKTSGQFATVLRGDAQAQGVQLDKAFRILLVVGAGIVLKGGNRGIEQAVALGATTRDDDIALVQLQAHFTVDVFLRRVNQLLQRQALRRPPVTVVDQFRILRHQTVFQVR